MRNGRDMVGISKTLKRTSRDKQRQYWTSRERKSKIVILALLVMIRGSPQDSEKGWTGELWSKTALLKCQN